MLKKLLAKKINKIKPVLWCSLVVFVMGSMLFTSQICKAAEKITQKAEEPTYPLYPTPNYGTGTSAKIIKRGEYLAKAGDCIACHTDSKHGGKPFAGGLGISTPFGTFYSPNITPDKETGIGNWTDEQFINAMQHGIRPDGSYYFPVFPYPYFAKMSKDDILAVKAYLMSIPAIRQTPPKNDVPWPFSWRFLQLGWRLMYFHEKPYQDDPMHTQAWNRGAYLVQGLGHCGMCHTPANLLGAPKNKYFLTGNFIGGYFAPDITGFGLKGSSVNEVEDVFLQDEMLKKSGRVEGPMAEVNHDSLMYLSRDDLRAIAVYLQSVQSKHPKTSSGPVGPDTGKKIYDAHCAVCHGTGAAGAPKLGDTDDWATRLKQGMPIVFQHAINGFNSMPPKGTCMTCSDEEIKAAVQYLADSSKPGAAGAGAMAAPKPMPRLTLADGKKIYDETCSVCHAQGLLGAPKVGDQAAWAPRIKQNMDVLFTHTINGYHRMPARGTCIDCSDAQIQAAVLYMVQQSKTTGDYSQW